MSTAINGAIAAAASSVIAADLVGELLGVAGAATEQQHELVVAVGDPTEVGAEPADGLLATVDRRRRSPS